MTGKRVAPARNVLIRELQGESVLLNLDSEAYFGLDEMGTEMWTALVAAPTVDAACHDLLARFEVEPQRLRDDVARFIDELAQAGLVDVNDV
jgi:hypothetical protein